MVCFVLYGVGHDHRCYLFAGEVYARRAFADSDASPLNGYSLMDNDAGVQVDTHDNVLSSLWTVVSCRYAEWSRGMRLFGFKAIAKQF